jgi:hypothetical protein
MMINSTILRVVAGVGIVGLIWYALRYAPGKLTQVFLQHLQDETGNTVPDPDVPPPHTPKGPAETTALQDFIYHDVQGHKRGEPIPSRQPRAEGLPEDPGELMPVFQKALNRHWQYHHRRGLADGVHPVQVRPPVWTWMSVGMLATFGILFLALVIFALTVSTK